MRVLGHIFKNDEVVGMGPILEHTSPGPEGGGRFKQLEVTLYLRSYSVKVTSRNFNIGWEATRTMPQWTDFKKYQDELEQLKNAKKRLINPTIEDVQPSPEFLSNFNEDGIATFNCNVRSWREKTRIEAMLLQHFGFIERVKSDRYSVTFKLTNQ